MKRKGIHKPTVEDTIELSGVEIMHPGGFALSKRTAEVAGLKPGLKVLDVSSGRGTQSIYYAQEFGVEVIGVDIADEMVKTATEEAKKAGIYGQVTFQQGDSQDLQFEDNSFDAVINECAVGIPDDSQKVLNEMVRVVKPGGAIVIHESTWRKRIPIGEKDEISERYGTTPLEYDEWMNMLQNAGVKEIVSEFDEWSKPEMFWKIRKDRDIKHYTKIFSLSEKLITVKRIFQKYGLRGVFKASKNQKILLSTILDGKLGYCLFKGIKD